MGWCPAHESPGYRRPSTQGHTREGQQLGPAGRPLSAGVPSSRDEGQFTCNNQIDFLISYPVGFQVT